MRIAFSTIAWDVTEDAAVAEMLSRHGIDAIDVAPGKYFPDPAAADAGDIRRVRHWWKARGIEITGMQALLFGTSGLNLFGEPESRKAMRDRLGAVCRVAELLGATPLVFGSPKSRDRSGLPDEIAERMAIAFFGDLGDLAATRGACICLEPNPARYGCNFMTTTAEAAAIVRKVNHDAIRLNLDTGTMAINGEDVSAVIQGHCDIIAHVHASEPDLMPLGDGGVDHESVADALRLHAPDRIVSIEMLARDRESHLAAMERALGVAIRSYRDGADNRKGLD